MINLKKELTLEVDFTAPEIEKILSYFHPVLIRKGQKTLLPGELSADLGFVSSGCLMLMHQCNDRSQIIELFSRNFFFVEVISFFKSRPTDFTIEAAVDTLIYVLPKKDFDVLSDHVPKWEKFMRLLTEKICLYLALECLEFRLSTNEEKYERLIKDRPFLFQELPLYIYRKLFMYDAGGPLQTKGPVGRAS